MNISEIYNKVIQIDKETSVLFSNYYGYDKELNALKLIFKQNDSLFSANIFYQLNHVCEKRLYLSLYFLRYRLLNNLYYDRNRFEYDRDTEYEELKKFGFNNLIELFNFISNTNIYDIKEIILNLKFNNLKRSKKYIDKQESFIIHDLMRDNWNLEINPIYSEKYHQAFCMTLDIPDDIKIHIPLNNNKIQLDTLLHEIGHYVHFSNMNNLTYEEKNTGDNSISEGFALLFESLNDNERFLKHIDYNECESLNTESYNVNYFLNILNNTINFYNKSAYDNETAIDHDMNSAKYLKGYILKTKIIEKLRDDWFNNENAIQSVMELMKTGFKFNYLELLNRFYNNGS